MAQALPETFGRYRILKPLGEGAMGAVYLARDTQLDRLVALKVPKLGEKVASHPETLERDRTVPRVGRDDSAEEETADSEALKRFFREARAAAALNHPNICAIHDIGEIDGIPFLTMAYLEGQPLSSLIERDKLMDQRQAARIARTLAQAMQEAHGRGVIHRDLKPSNVMMTARGEPVIMDFGIAWRDETVEAQLTKSGTILGTPAFMAPEQIEGSSRAVGPACDIYSLGVILYQLVTARLPFQGSVMSVLGQILYQPPEPPSKYRTDLDRTLEAICLKAMAKQPKDRYATMADFASALDGYLRGGAEAETLESPSWGTTPAPSLSQARSWIRKAAFLAGGVVGVVLLAAGYVVYDRISVGSVQIKLSEPAAAVEVVLDGQPIERASLGGPLRLRAGQHHLSVSGSGYQPWSRKFMVRRGSNPPLTVGLTASPAAARLEPLATAAEKIPTVTASRPPSTVSQTSSPAGEPAKSIAQAKPSTVSQTSSPAGEPAKSIAQAKPSPPPAAAREEPEPPRPSAPAQPAAAVAGSRPRDSRSRPGAPAQTITNGIGMKLVLIPAGTFLIGSPASDRDFKYQRPQREVRISRPFYLGIHEVTQGQYQAVMGNNPSWFSAQGGGKDAVKGLSTTQHPVENVSWFDAVRFCNSLSKREGLKPFYTIEGEVALGVNQSVAVVVHRKEVRVPDWNGTGYRLPTEAEWEYASRWGSRTRPSAGGAANDPARQAWFVESLEKATHPVTQQQPNPWGLHDMHGNVWEWCWDWDSGESYKNLTNVDPKGAAKGTERVLRGGHFFDFRYHRLAVRHRDVPTACSRVYGFRLARTFE